METLQGNENSFQCLTNAKLESNGQKPQIVPKESDDMHNHNKKISSEASLTEQNKQCKNKKLTGGDTGKKPASILSVLDSYCKTNFLDESDDFIECDSMNKFKSGSQNIDIILCEICKEDITCLDVHNRGIHVNDCIDKQIPSTSEDTKLPSNSENIFILECPLCFKHFSSPELRSNHIKKCGKSKGLCTQSIVKALELQERHALERISLGLPAKPIKPVKSHKNLTAKRAIVEPKNKAESDIQLAKALSLSLSKPDQESDIKAHENINTTILKPPTMNQRPGKKTKQKISSIKLLVLRSEEDRKKLLLDKVATILSHGSDSEQYSSIPVETNVLTSKQENNIQVASTLWHLSCKASEKYYYYVEELLDWIKPSNVETGAKLCHLSQIPGHEIVTQLPCEYTFNMSQKSDMTNAHSPKKSSSSVPHSPFITEALSSLVASSWMSDVDIRTACGTIIPAHRLFLAVRCPPLKQDSNFCSETGRVALKWDNISFDAALLFLNFVYTGSIDIKEDVVSDLLYLAKMYEMFDLLTELDNFSKNDGQSDIQLFNKAIPLNSDDLPSSSQTQSTGKAKYLPRESQEDMNMDLDIVCDCINSSLKPSQSSYLNDFFSSKCLKCSQIPEVTPEITTRVDHSKCESVIKHSEEVTVCNNLLPEDNCISTSPVVFDINHSENDSSDLSDNEVANLSVNCSQKSEINSKQIDVKKVNLFTTENSNSEDSIKCLYSSYTSIGKSSETPDKIDTNILSLSPAFSQVTSQSSEINNLPQNSQVSEQNKCEVTASEQHASDKREFVINKDAEIESPCSPYSEILYCSFHSLDGDEIKTSFNVEVKDVSKANSSPFHDSLDNKNMLDETNEIVSPFKIKNETKKSPTSGEFSSEYKSEFLNEHSPFKINVLSAFKPNDYSVSISPVRDTPSPIVLISVSDSDSKSQEHSLCKTPSSHDASDADFSKKIISSDTLPTDSPMLSNSSLHKASTCLFRPMEDAIYESFEYMDHETSFPNEIPIQSPKTLKCLDKEQIDETDDSVFEPRLMVSKPILPVKHLTETSTKHIKQHPICKTFKNSAIPSNSPDTLQPRFQLSDSPVTPLPDYKNMMTPEIKQALKRIGVKALPRKKAVAILSHVYDETHPLVDGETNTEISSQVSLKSQKVGKVSKAKKRKQLSVSCEKPAKKQQKENYTKENTLASPESDGSCSDNPEWLGCVPEMSFSQSTEDSPTKVNKDDIESIKLYIQSHEELYYNILNYTPLNLIEFHQELKNNSIKISIQKLMDFLDEQCITFTCPRKEEYRKKQTARTQRFRKNMIAKISQEVR